MKTYRKTYQVHNTLITYGVWEEHQTLGWKKRFGVGTPPAIFDVHGGVADVYYTSVFGTFRQVMEIEYKKDRQIFTRMMDEYEAQLQAMHARINSAVLLKNASELIAFAEQFQAAWIGLDLSYMPDYIAMDTAAERRSASVREQAFGFYIGADRLIRLSLEQLFPDLGLLSSYLTLDEVKANKPPRRPILEARAHHFIYYQKKVYTDVSLEDLCEREQIRLESVYAPLRKELRGLVASEGIAKGNVQIMADHTKPIDVKRGAILIARDLEARDLPLLKQAAGLILDAGEYYGFAATAMRTLKKPCIFSTKIATMILQNGEPIKIDSQTGTIHLE